MSIVLWPWERSPAMTANEGSLHHRHNEKLEHKEIRKTGMEILQFRASIILDSPPSLLFTFFIFHLRHEILQQRFHQFFSDEALYRQHP
jgi:hypothetical protein